MKVRAKHWLKHNGTWYKGGDTFDVPADDLAELKNMVVVLDAPKPVAESVAEEVKTEQPKKRRSRKASAE